jgi:ABC-2 type transport system ATP-binding protein
MVCGLLRPDGGEGRVLSLDVRRESNRIKERVGYMTQRFSLYEDLSIRENLEFIARLYSLDHVRDRVSASLKSLGLSDRATQRAGQLSGGWKQRLALAACMIHEPELLLLDEPTAGVDPKARRDFWDAIREYAAEGVTTLVSTHYMDEAVQCDRIAFIAYGRKMIDAGSAEIPSRVGLFAWRIRADNLDAATRALKDAGGCDVIARFGAAIHVAGRDREAVERALASLAGAAGLQVSEIDAGLEESFIYLMTGAVDNFAAAAA